MKVMELQRKNGNQWNRKEALFLTEQEEVSLITGRGKELIKKDLDHGKAGFCHRRFKANILAKSKEGGTEYRMQRRDQLLGEEVTLIITKAGKNCHNHCPIYTKEGCSFLQEIFFLTAQSSGKIALNEELNYQQGIKESTDQKKE